MATSLQENSNNNTPFFADTADIPPPPPPPEEKQQVIPAHNTGSKSSSGFSKANAGSSASSFAPNIIKPPSKARYRKKIIATILILLIVAGGIGAGVFLSQRRQEIREKAFIPPEDVIKVLDCAKFKVYISEEEKTQCPQILQCTPNGIQTNNITSYSSTWTITIEAKPGFENEKAEIRTITESNYCPDSPCGEFIEGYPVCDEPDPNNPPKGETFELGHNESKSITVTSQSTSGKACGSYQTRLHIGVLNCEPPVPPTETPISTLPPTPTPTATVTPTEVPEPTIPPMPQPTKPPKRPRPPKDPCEGLPRRACLDVGPDGFCQTGLTCELLFTPTPSPSPSPTASPTVTPTSTPTLGPTYTNQPTNAPTPQPTERTAITQTLTPTSTPQQIVKEESLPEAGSSTPTIIGTGISILLLVISIALAI